MLQTDEGVLVSQVSRLTRKSMEMDERQNVLPEADEALKKKKTLYGMLRFFFNIATKIDDSI